MNFSEFVSLINNLNSLPASSPIVLLEGKREVREDEKHLLIELGKKLAICFPSVKFRTGNASGADELFAKGVTDIDPLKIEYILPYNGHRKKHISELSYAASVDDITLAKEPGIIYQTKSAGTKNANIIDQYESGIRNRITIKASYLIRDTVKVLGSESLNLKKADAAVFYDDMDDPGKGGTGHTMRVCIQNNVPIITQGKWIKWL